MQQRIEANSRYKSQQHLEEFEALERNFNEIKIIAQTK